MPEKKHDEDETGSVNSLGELLDCLSDLGHSELKPTSENAENQTPAQSMKNPFSSLPVKEEKKGELDSTHFRKRNQSSATKPENFQQQEPGNSEDDFFFVEDPLTLFAELEAWSHSAQQLRSANQPTAQTKSESLNQKESEGLHRAIAHLDQKLNALQDQIETPTDLIDPLLPLIRELLELKTGNSREEILQAVVPVIDEVIAERSRQDRAAVAHAIAAAIPLAINQQIQTAPKEIARAIAPEIALALKEQTLLRESAISEALGPEMGRAIKAQIELERDAMVDALYPVIGDTIAKYMAEVIQSINEKVETALSPAGITRKIRARLQGVSEAELILRESMPFTVQAVFLIHKFSGLVIAEVQPASSHRRLESDLLAGMLTAIRQFVNDCVTDSDTMTELNEIEYGNSRIILEVAGYCYLAVVVKGNPAQTYKTEIRQILAKLLQEQGDAIKAYEGDPETIPEPVQSKLEKLLSFETESNPEKPAKKFPTTLLLLVFGLASLIFVPLGIFWYRDRVASQIESDVAIALDAAPDLSVYRLIPHLKDETLTLTGRVPQESLREKAARVAQNQIPDDLEVDNQIVAVNVPPPPEAVAAELQRIVAVFNQQEATLINAAYEAGSVNVKGVIPELSLAEEISRSLLAIPGVEAVQNTWQLEPPALRQQIYFARSSAQINPADLASKIKPIAQFLKRYPHVHLRMMGYSDAVGDLQVKRDIALKRAKAVEKALVNQGIVPERLVSSASIEFPPGVTSQAPSRESRVTRFEAFVPATNASQTN